MDELQKKYSTHGIAEVRVPVNPDTVREIDDKIYWGSWDAELRSITTRAKETKKTPDTIKAVKDLIDKETKWRDDLIAKKEKENKIAEATAKLKLAEKEAEQKKKEDEQKKKAIEALEKQSKDMEDEIVNIKLAEAEKKTANAAILHLMLCKNGPSFYVEICYHNMWKSMTNFL